PKQIRLLAEQTNHEDEEGQKHSYYPRIRGEDIKSNSDVGWKGCSAGAYGQRDLAIGALHGRSQHLHPGTPVRLVLVVELEACSDRRRVWAVFHIVCSWLDQNR